MSTESESVLCRVELPLGTRSVHALRFSLYMVGMLAAKLWAINNKEDLESLHQCPPKLARFATVALHI